MRLLHIRSQWQYGFPIVTFGKALAVINNILNYYPSNHDLLDLRDKLVSDLNAKSIEAFSPSNTRGKRDSQNSADDSGISNSLTSKTIAELYMKQGLLKDAILELKRIFDENPNDDSIREKLSKLQSYVFFTFINFNYNFCRP